MVVIVILQFYGWGNWDLAILSKISKTAQQINGRAGILTQDFKLVTMTIESLIFFFLIIVVLLFVIPWTVACQSSLVHRISQARMLEWVAISFSRRSSWPTHQNWVCYISGRFFTSEPVGKLITVNYNFRELFSLFASLQSNFGFFSTIFPWNLPNCCSNDLLIFFRKPRWQVHSLAIFDFPAPSTVPL